MPDTPFVRVTLDKIYEEQLATKHLLAEIVPIVRRHEEMLRRHDEEMETKISKGGAGWLAGLVGTVVGALGFLLDFRSML